ncbi:MAG: hypothetical protein U9R49_00335 [Bacteroidota bacterium]|nr:hypothetical protein [Bacteroidota bacterium]
MRRAIAPFILLLFVLAGCETEKDPVEEPLDPSLHLTDGFCLLKNSRVVLNHYDIDYYDYSAHLIYLKDPGAFEEKFKEQGPGAVCADSTWIYDLSYVFYVSSYIPQGPVIWFPLILYADDIVHIDQAWETAVMMAGGPDPREDPRIVEALKKYGQFRHGIQFEIVSVQYNSPDDVVLELDMWNEDAVNYYYWDPEKIGMEIYLYISMGLTFYDTDSELRYRHRVEPAQPDSWNPLDLENMSLLKSDSTVRLSFAYDRFDTVPTGNYVALFEFAAPTFNIEREDLEQPDGRIWLGEQYLTSEEVVE